MCGLIIWLNHFVCVHGIMSLQMSWNCRRVCSHVFKISLSTLMCERHILHHPQNQTVIYYSLMTDAEETQWIWWRWEQKTKRWREGEREVWEGNERKQEDGDRERAEKLWGGGRMERETKKSAGEASRPKLILTVGRAAWWISEPWLEFTCQTHASSFQPLHTQ